MERALQTLPIRRTLRFHNQFCGTRQDPALRGKLKISLRKPLPPGLSDPGFSTEFTDELFALSGGLPTAAELVASGNGIRLNGASKILEQVFWDVSDFFPVHRKKPPMAPRCLQASAVECSLISHRRSLINTNHKHTSEAPPLPGSASQKDGPPDSFRRSIYLFLYQLTETRQILFQIFNVYCAGCASGPLLSAARSSVWYCR